MLNSRSCETVVSVAVVVVSTTGEVATTSTVSATVPSSNPTRRVIVRPIARSRVGSSWGRKPVSSARNEYGPGLSPTKRNSPLSLLTVVWDPVRPVSVTVTPGRTAPWTSVTVPVMVPDKD